MISKGKAVIQLTNDPQKYGICAKMMSTSDPWITLKIDYDQCLRAFDGISKEVYIIEIN